MNAVDILVLIILGFSVFSGIRKGFIKSIFEFLALIIAVLGAYTWFMDLGELLGQWIKIEARYVYILSFAILWIVIFGVVNVLGTLAQKVINKTFLAPVNIAGGIILGLIKGAVFSAIIVVPVIFASIVYAPLNNYVQDSYTIKYIKPFFTGYIDSLLPEDLPDVFDLKKKIKVKPDLKEAKNILEIPAEEIKDIALALENVQGTAKNSNNSDIKEKLKSIDTQKKADVIELYRSLSPEQREKINEIIARELHDDTE